MSKDDYINVATKIADALNERTGTEFDGECHLTEAEAKGLIALSLAAGKIMDGLNARIEAACDSGDGVPVFYAIADMNDALHATLDAFDA